MSWWDDQAATLQGARLAVWSDPDWFAGIGRSIEALAPMLEWASRLPDLVRLVDWGCGVGRVTLPVTQLLPLTYLVGVDRSDKMLNWAEVRRVEAGINPNVVQFRSPDDAPACDGGWSMLTFQHCHPGQVIADMTTMRQHTRYGGRWWWQWVVGEHHDGRDHRYTESQMVALATEAGFNVVDVTADRHVSEHRWIEVTP